VGIGFCLSGVLWLTHFELSSLFFFLIRLSAVLAAKIRNYVEFSFSVTKGINVDLISDQLPPYLQVLSAAQLQQASLLLFPSPTLHGP
jgi:hypothetical protein